MIDIDSSGDGHAPGLCPIDDLPDDVCRMAVNLLWAIGASGETLIFREWREAMLPAVDALVSRGLAQAEILSGGKIMVTLPGWDWRTRLDRATGG